MVVPARDIFQDIITEEFNEYASIIYDAKKNNL